MVAAYRPTPSSGTHWDRSSIVEYGLCASTLELHTHNKCRWRSSQCFEKQAVVQIGDATDSGSLHVTFQDHDPRRFHNHDPGGPEAELASIHV